MWFAVLGFGASVAWRWLQQPEVWRAVDGSAAVVMFIVAAQDMARNNFPGHVLY